jgi:TonB family protein
MLFGMGLLTAGAVLGLGFFCLPTIQHLGRYDESLHGLSELLAMSSYLRDRCDWGDRLLAVDASGDPWLKAERLRCHDRVHPQIAGQIRRQECPSVSSTDPNGLASLYRPSPIYPEEALHRGVEGRVLIEFGVTQSGTVESPVVVAIEGEVFRAVALHAVSKWIYCVGPDYDAASAERRRIALPFRIADEPMR